MKVRRVIQSRRRADLFPRKLVPPSIVRCAAARYGGSIDPEPLKDAPEHARNGAQRLSGFSTVIALAITVTAAATLHSGTTQIESSAQAAEALKPIAGSFAQFFLFVVFWERVCWLFPSLAARCVWCRGNLEMADWRHPNDASKNPRHRTVLVKAAKPTFVCFQRARSG
jgi:hypothetical protein